MKTEIATVELAIIWAYGGSSEAAQALERCKEHSIRWSWESANTEMQRAYELLGSTAPMVREDSIHRGEHPVQIEARRILEGDETIFEIRKRIGSVL